MYNEIVTRHFKDPEGAGKIDDADLVGQSGTKGQGYWIILYVKLDNGRVAGAGFETYGCPAVIASGSMLVHLIRGRRIEELAEIDEARLTEELGGLPLGKEHGPRIAAAALKDALGKVNAAAMR
jgi:NifU-like protein involved in Fe-S cluster formation